MQKSENPGSGTGITLAALIFTVIWIPAVIAYGWGFFAIGAQVSWNPTTWVDVPTYVFAAFVVIGVLPPFFFWMAVLTLRRANAMSRSAAELDRIARRLASPIATMEGESQALIGAVEQQLGRLQSGMNDVEVRLAGIQQRISDQVVEMKAAGEEAIEQAKSLEGRLGSERQALQELARMISNEAGHVSEQLQTWPSIGASAGSANFVDVASTAVDDRAGETPPVESEDRSVLSRATSRLSPTGPALGTIQATGAAVAGGATAAWGSSTVDITQDAAETEELGVEAEQPAEQEAVEEVHADGFANGVDGEQEHVFAEELQTAIADDITPTAGDEVGQGIPALLEEPEAAAQAEAEAAAQAEAEAAAQAEAEAVAQAEAEAVAQAEAEAAAQVEAEAVAQTEAEAAAQAEAEAEALADAEAAAQAEAEAAAQAEAEAAAQAEAEAVAQAEAEAAAQAEAEAAAEAEAEAAAQAEAEAAAQAEAEAAAQAEAEAAALEPEQIEQPSPEQPADSAPFPQPLFAAKLMPEGQMGAEEDLTADDAEPVLEDIEEDIEEDADDRGNSGPAISTPIFQVPGTANDNLIDLPTAADHMPEEEVKLFGVSGPVESVEQTEDVPEAKPDYLPPQPHSDVPPQDQTETVIDSWSGGEADADLEDEEDAAAESPVDAELEEEDTRPTGADLAAAAGSHSTRHLVEGLHALSIDLSRALDINPPVDLWRRYMAGERHVFTDFVLDWFEGSDEDSWDSAFEKSTDLRKYADRYRAQFDTLLERAEEEGEQAASTEQFLESDIGRLYTYLEEDQAA